MNKIQSQSLLASTATLSNAAEIGSRAIKNMITSANMASGFDKENKMQMKEISAILLTTIIRKVKENNNVK